MNIVSAPSKPIVKKTDIAIRKIRSTCFLRTELCGVLEIMIVNADGSPAVATKYNVVKILYAILKYPIPLSPKTSCKGTLQRSPNSLTARLDAVKIITPEISLGPEDLFFCNGHTYAFSGIKIIFCNVEEVIFYFLNIQSLVFAIFIQNFSVDHRHNHVGGVRTVQERVAVIIDR